MRPAINYTTEIHAIRQTLDEQQSRIEDLERQLANTTASLVAAGVSQVALLHALVVKVSVDSSNFRAAFDDIAKSAELALASMPIAGAPEYASEVRQFAANILNGSLINLQEALVEWDAQGRPTMTDSLAALN